MKIVVIGGSGLIGTHVVAQLLAQGHEVVAASPRTGVDTVSGEGLAQALAGAQVVVDVSNAPSFEDQAVLDFFRTSTGNLLRTAKAANVQHLLVLSVVGSERLPDSGYFRAKVVQEDLVRAGGLPFTIVRATQFFEFIASIADASAADHDEMLARLDPVEQGAGVVGQVLQADGTHASIIANRPGGP